MQEKVERFQQQHTKKEQIIEQQNAGGKQMDKDQSQLKKKDIETLSEGERMGLSKQQLRKLQKIINAKKKKEVKDQQAKIAALNKESQLKEDIKGKKPKQEPQIDEATRQQFNKQKIIGKVNKSLPSQQQDNILITSALPYVNNVPHLGNIIGCVLSADVFSRFKKLQGANALFICGTDEYGTSTEVRAMQQKKTPQQICDYYHKIHAEVYKWFDIGFDYFGRTSTEWHTKITQQIFSDIQKAGRITKEEMTQCYCSHCDLFLADKFICGICPFCGYDDARGDQCDKCQKLFNFATELKDYRCQICRKAPQIKQTIHFFIDLPKIQPELQKWFIAASEKGDWSQNSIAITKAWLKMGLRPKCITRDLKWGVAVPVEEFKKKVFYVWFDAPIGYISITACLLQEDYKKWWLSPDVKLFQFMGKDNVPFHTVMFPSSLMASRQEWTLLHHISTTEYLTYEGRKFSKSNGIGVFGNHAIELEQSITSEVWRYYLLVNRPEKTDSQFCWEDFIHKNNNELLANLGNLVHRVLRFIYNHENKQIPVLQEQHVWTEQDDEFVLEMQGRYQRYVALLEKVQIKEGLKYCMQISSQGNKYLQDSQFWQKEHRDSGRTHVVLNVIANFLRFQSFIIEPFMPSTSAKINYLLGLENRTEQDAVLGKILNDGDFKSIFLNLTAKSTGIRQPIPLFTAYTEEQAKAWRQRFKGVASQ